MGWIKQGKGNLKTYPLYVPAVPGLAPPPGFCCGWGFLPKHIFGGFGVSVG